MFVYVASADIETDAGIRAYKFDLANGRMKPIQYVAIASPAAIAVSASRRTLYTTSRTGDGIPGATDALMAYSIAPSGLLTYLSRTPISPPSYLSLDRTERFALYVSTFSGVVGTAPLSRAGSVGPAQEWHLPGVSLLYQGYSRADIGKRPFPSGQATFPYAPTTFPHCVRMSPDNRFAIIADLALNCTHVYRFDAKTGELTPNEPPSLESVPIRKEWLRKANPVWDMPVGAGPRHFEFHPNGRWIYLDHERGSVVTVLEYDARLGTLRQLQEIPTLPDDYVGSSSPADIHVHPTGRFVYVTNRRHDTIASYAVDAHNGRLTLLGFTPTLGYNPRTFTFTPNGRLLLLGNMASNAIVVFEVDASTGSLTPNGVVNEVLSPLSPVVFGG